MSASFQFDVYNNTAGTLNFSTSGNTFLEGADVSFTVSNGGWMSTEHNNDAPFGLELTGDTGSLTFSIQDAVTGAEATFTLEFDSTSLTNFNGMAFYGSAGDIANPLKTSNGYIFPLLYMNQLFGGSPLAVLMFVEAANASPDVNTPYPVS
jgi:hypothetical protein